MKSQLAFVEIETRLLAFTRAGTVDSYPQDYFRIEAFYFGFRALSDSLHAVMSSRGLFVSYDDTMLFPFQKRKHKRKIHSPLQK